MYKKVLMSLTVTLILVSSSITAAAGNIEKGSVNQTNVISFDGASGEIDVEAALEFINSAESELVGDQIELNNEFVDMWNQLKTDGGVFADRNGNLVLKDSEVQEHSELVDLLATWNYAIDIGLLSLDSDTMELYTPEITYDVLSNVSDHYVKMYEEAVPYASPHGCGNTVWNVSSLCSQNYAIISKFYNSMVAASGPNPGVLPWSSTVGYWVGLVMEKGAWDYKANPDYMGRYFCLIYGNTKYDDQYVEWVGNYNYGYTGKFLFNLATLHTGSSAVAGFDPKDKETDWPAIDEGYYDAP